MFVYLKVARCFVDHMADWADEPVHFVETVFDQVALQLAGCVENCRAQLAVVDVALLGQVLSNVGVDCRFTPENLKKKDEFFTN